MLSRIVLSIGIIAALSGAVTARSAIARSLKIGAQARKQAAKPYAPPRMPDGHPDLQGTYDLATLTPLERPAGMNAILTDEEAGKLERNVATQNELRGRAISGDRTAPPKGGDGSIGPAGGVGGYNNFWLD